MPGKLYYTCTCRKERINKTFRSDHISLSIRLFDPRGWISRVRKDYNALLLPQYWLSRLDFADNTPKVTNSYKIRAIRKIMLTTFNNDSSYKGRACISMDSSSIALIPHGYAWLSALTPCQSWPLYIVVFFAPHAWQFGDEDTLHQLLEPSIGRVRACTLDHVLLLLLMYWTINLTTRSMVIPKC